MEASAGSSSKKRKQPPSSTLLPSNENPFTGILTRKKTQKYFFHHNRSGASRKSRLFPKDLDNPNSLTGRKFSELSNVSVAGNGEEDDDEIYHIAIKDLRARRVFSKPPKSDEEGKVRDDLSGKDENPISDCGLIDGKSNGSDCEKSDVEIPKLFEKCVDSDEVLTVGSPNLLSSNMCDDYRVNCEEKGLIVGNNNLIVSESCDDSRVTCQIDGLIGEKSDTVISGMCDDSRVNLDKEGSIGGKPNLVVLQMCNESRVTSDEEKGSNGSNPNLSNSDSKLNCEAEGLIVKNPNFLISDTTTDCKGGRLDGAKYKCEGKVWNETSPNLSNKSLQCGCGEENVQTTPPDAVVLLRQRVDQSVLKNKSAESRSPPKQISPSKGASAEGKKSISNPRRNLGLNPCSRLKLFKTPNSFGYRRMLPFLMDMAKDEPSAPKINPIIKNETNTEAKSLVFSSQEIIIETPEIDQKPLEPIAPCKPQEINTGTKEEEKLSLSSKTSDSTAEQLTPCASFACPLETNLEIPVSDEIHLGTPVSNDSKTEESSTNGRVISLDTSLKIGDLSATLSSPKVSTEPPEGDATLNATSHLSPTAERECSEAHLVSLTEGSPVSVVHGSPKMKAVVSSDQTGCGLAKGILKRNPRGCRGICDCLNCASFRLNAEKAFEFSRNQWLEAEEIAMDLMKELSCLRNVLEKSVIGANDNAVVPIDQVQDICKRASTAEDIARTRLSQMNEDLHVHCRVKPLQRPRVTFSSNVQEKIIGDLSR